MASTTGAMTGTGAGTRERHPKGLYVLFATEMWERFSFYTMLAMLTLYLKDTTGDGFGWTTAKATGLYANYLMFVYASPLIGGWIADRKIGFRKAITIGGIFFTIGHVLLAFPTVPALYSALVCLVIGNGFFKPNVSTLVGNLYPAGSPLRDAAYNIFYMGINIGAFAAPLIAEAVKSRYGFHPAFVVAGAGMVIGMLIFWTFQKHVAYADVRKSKLAVSPDVAGDKQNPAAVSVDLPPVLNEKARAMEAVPERRRVMALIVIFLIVIVFWMIFHQNGSTLTYWANDNTNWASSRALPTIIKVLTLGFVEGDDISGIVSNSINPFWIIVLTFPLIAFWRMLGRRGLEPSTPMKMAIGMTLTGASFMILYFAAKAGGDTGKVSPWWLIIAYLVISLGELMLSPMGLSLVSKVAPERMRGMMMGGWFVATAIGNKLTAIGVFWDVWAHSKFFLTLAMMAFVMAVVLLVLLKPLKKAMPGV
ncbi:MAG TPA: peptide MFS transporter [Thermoanaerobaculia bacterium]|nr:peptide MFS transporter [Thermoanaerobaculia bacterium]